MYRRVDDAGAGAAAVVSCRAGTAAGLWRAAVVPAGDAAVQLWNVGSNAAAAFKKSVVPLKNGIKFVKVLVSAFAASG